MRTRPCIQRLLAFLFLLANASASAAVTKDYAVLLTATVQKTPPQITLNWPADATATQYTVARRNYGAPTWGSSTVLAGTATSFTDSTVAVGSAYEYRVNKSASGYSGLGYILSGIEVPLTEMRGKLILVVENTYAADLATELTRLQQDLIGDGWTVLRHDVARTDTVVSVKNLIRTDYLADPTNVKAVFLFGRVPVPYAGNIAPDGHTPDHVGAWPADVYYGELNGTWTDTSVNNTGASRAENDNIPGDGKFDQSSIPNSMELWVGRVDLANMPAFTGKSEKDLLRQYLNKDHNFRHKLITAQARGLIDDNFGAFSGEAFAASAWRSFATMFGASNISDNSQPGIDFFPTLGAQSYLFSYGCGGGSYTSASGVGSTTNFVSTDTKTVFTMLFGSYHGDWDSTNNFMRAPLASTTYGLTCAWSGRPHWSFHTMSLGECIGQTAWSTQNASWSVHVALMGDPALRLHVVGPPGAVTCTPGNGMVLSWPASADTVAGYNVYRSTSATGPFTRLNTALIPDATYTDNTATPGDYTYMVRAVRPESVPVGSYFNASQGIFQSATVPLLFTSAASATPNPATAGVPVQFTCATNGATGYLWDFGDGTTDATSGASVTHVFAAANTYAVTVTATLASVSATSSLSLVVQNSGGGGGGATGAGWITPTADDTDGDGVSNANELSMGTDPANPYSFAKVPMTVSKLQASGKFSVSGKDSVALSGVLPDLPALFQPAKTSVRLSVGGAVVAFVVDAKGRATALNGKLSMKFKSKRNPSTRKSEFAGGAVPFGVRLTGGSWVAAWGWDIAADRKNFQAQMVVDLAYNGLVYTATVPGLYSAKAQLGGKFKKK